MTPAAPLPSDEAGSPAPEASSAPPTPASPIVSPPGVGTPPSPLPTPRRSWLLVIVAIVLVAVVVLAVLDVAGVFTSSTSSPPVPDGTPATYSTAVAVAITEGKTAVGGPWTPVVGLGIGVSIGISQPSAGQFVGNSCTDSTPPGAPASVSVLGTPSNATPGEVATWAFLEKNASGTVILMVFVSDGNAAPVTYVRGCSGVASFSSESGINATDVVDSTVIASTFNAGGGSGFLANHTSVTRMFVVLGAGSALGGSAFWEASYSTCGFGALGGSGTTLVAYYYASSGSLFNGPILSQVGC